MHPFYFFISIGFLACCPAKTENLKPVQTEDLSMECSDYYPFKGNYINLETNTKVELKRGPAAVFTKCSKFAHRFKNPVNDTVFAGGYQFIVSDYTDKTLYRMLIYKDGKLTKAVNLPVEIPLPDVHRYSFNLVPFKNDVIMFMQDLYGTHFTICKYNVNGEEVMRTKIEHTYITHPEPNTDHHNNYLYFKEATATELIFSSHHFSGEKQKTVVLSMENFKKREFNQTVHGVILDENEEKTAGFVTNEGDVFTIQMIDGKHYQFEIQNGNPGCEMILKEGLLYIANFHPIATGSSLHCFDLQTGKMKWTADVLQVFAEHSKYWNKVTLSVYKNKLIMQGDEAYGSYVQIFDVKSGKRFAHFGNVG